jgi:hypothetical protein
MVNGRKLSRLGRKPFAWIHSEEFFIEFLELGAGLRTFDEEKHEYPLTVCFAGCHKCTHCGNGNPRRAQSMVRLALSSGRFMRTTMKLAA